MAMHLGRHMTTIHSQVPKTAKRKKAARVGGRKGRPAVRTPEIVGGLGLRSLSLEQLAGVITAIKEKVQGRIAEIQELLLPGAPRRPGRPAGRQAAAAPKALVRRKRRAPRKFKLTGRESILTFVRARGAKGATTAEIVKSWLSQGRSGDGYTAIGELVKARRLKREPLEGQAGSRYMVL
jgi:hypothetical protein